MIQLKRKDYQILPSRVQVTGVEANLCLWRFRNNKEKVYTMNTFLVAPFYFLEYYQSWYLRVY